MDPKEADKEAHKEADKEADKKDTEEADKKDKEADKKDEEDQGEVEKAEQEKAEEEEEEEEEMCEICGMFPAAPFTTHGDAYCEQCDDMYRAYLRAQRRAATDDKAEGEGGGTFPYGRRAPLPCCGWAGGGEIRVVS